MENVEIKIWDIDCGKVQSLKIDDAIFPLMQPFNYELFEKTTKQIDDPVEVAKAFVKLFDLRHAKKVDGFHEFKFEENNTTASTNENGDIIESVGAVDIKKSNLLLLYEMFKDQDYFTSDDVYNNTRGKILSFGRISINIYMDYLKRIGAVKIIQRNRFYYKFIVPFEEWEFNKKTTPISIITKHNMENPQKGSSDLVHQTEYGLNITEEKLRTVYNAVKPRTKFTVYDAKKALKEVPGYSEPVIRGCMKYLVNRGYAAYVSGAIGHTKTYTFLVSPSEWRFGNKTIDTYKPTCSPQDDGSRKNVVINPPSVKVDFDSEEVRNRRMLEMNTARGEA